MPVVLDAGVGTASDAALAMELGCDAVHGRLGDRPRAGPRPDGARDAGRRAGRHGSLAAPGGSRGASTRPPRRRRRASPTSARPRHRSMGTGSVTTCVHCTSMVPFIVVGWIVQR